MNNIDKFIMKVCEETCNSIPDISYDFYSLAALGLSLDEIKNIYRKYDVAYIGYAKDILFKGLSKEKCLKVLSTLKEFENTNCYDFNEKAKSIINIL